MKIALGTVQFGTDYGAFGTGTKVTIDQVARILDAARTAGITVLDTARGYGTSEDVLGQMDTAAFKVVTKCPGIIHPDEIAPAFAASQGALQRPVYGYLLHNAQDLLGDHRDAVWRALCQLRDGGQVTRIGISAYSLAEVTAVLAHYPITLVQLPAHVLTPWYTDCQLPDTLEVHIRSAFLQGFLLSNPTALPKRFAPWQSTLQTFCAQAKASGLSQLQAALAPLVRSDAIDCVVVGVDGFTQLQEILTAVETIPDVIPQFGPFPDVTAALTDPRTWNEA